MDNSKIFCEFILEDLLGYTYLADKSIANIVRSSFAYKLIFTSSFIELSEEGSHLSRYTHIFTNTYTHKLICARCNVIVKQGSLQKLYDELIRCNRCKKWLDIALKPEGVDKLSKFVRRIPWYRSPFQIAAVFALLRSTDALLFSSRELVCRDIFEWMFKDFPIDLIG